MRRRRSDKGKVVATGIRADGLLERLSGEPALSYRLRLYIAGSNLNSFRAIQNVRDLCDRLLQSRCELEIIDLYQQPALAKRDEVIAAPALIKTFPLPRRIFVGDLSDTAKVLRGLGINAKKTDGKDKGTGQQKDTGRA